MNARAARRLAALSGRPVALSSSGELLSLPFVHAGQPILAVRRWAEPRVAGSIVVMQGMQIRPILIDPLAYVIGSADGSVARDDDANVVRHVLEQPQRGEVVLDRVSGAAHVEQRNQ